MKKLVFIILMSLSTYSFSQEIDKTTNDKVNLKCVGEVEDRSKGEDLKKYQGEVFYELSQNLVVRHIGTQRVEFTRDFIEKKIDSNNERSHGWYTFEPLTIGFSRTTILSPKSKGERHYMFFSINRQNGNWEVEETHEPGLFQSKDRHFSIHGSCERWDPKPKF